MNPFKRPRMQYVLHIHELHVLHIAKDERKVVDLKIIFNFANHSTFSKPMHSIYASYFLLLLVAMEICEVCSYFLPY